MNNQRNIFLGEKIHTWMSGVNKDDNCFLDLVERELTNNEKELFNNDKENIGR